MFQSEDDQGVWVCSSFKLEYSSFQAHLVPHALEFCLSSGCHRTLGHMESHTLSPEIPVTAWPQCMYPLLFLIAVKLSGKNTFHFPFLDLPQKPQQAGAQQIRVELKDNHGSLLLLLSYIKQWISTFSYSSLSRGCLFPLAVAQIWITSTVL